MTLFDAINHGIGIVLTLLAIVGLFSAWSVYVIRNIQKYQQAIQERKTPKLTRSEIFFQATIYLLFILGLILVFWGLPIILEAIFFGTKFLTILTRGAGWLFWAVQWIEAGLIALGILAIFAKKHGEKRWITSLFLHLAVLLFGWLVQKWIGIFFVSLPLLFSYYVLLYHLSDVLLPCSYPESAEQTVEEKAQSRSEKWKRFKILAAFTWGLQLPILVVGKHAWETPETRISGDFTWDYPVPGLLYTKSHQVAAITAGHEFRRVDGPGVVFTGKLERPFQIIDLRLQLRTSEIDVVSKDGISFKAVVFCAFRIDNENWDDKTYEDLRRRNPLLRGADKLDYTAGSFWFSRARIRATISTTSSLADDPKFIIPWDRWALKVIEGEARQIISKKNLDELWRPSNDEKYASALNAIADELKTNTTPLLRAAGILLYAARIVNFSFITQEGKISPISEQQIAGWKSLWQQKRLSILANAAAEAEKMQQEARVYAHKILLEAIADGLQKTKEIHPQLPRYVIESRFLSALQDFIRQTPTDSQNPEMEKRISEMQNYLRNWQTTFFPEKKERQ